MDNLKVAFIGAGNMAKAMIAGLVKAGFPAPHIWASGPRQETLDPLKACYGIQVSTNNLEAAMSADMIFIAVKPQKVRTILEQLAPHLQAAGKLFVSVAAGVDMASLRLWSKNCAIARCMPNLPVQSCSGMCGLYGELGSTHRKQLESLLGSLGQVLWVNSDAELNAVIALAGSGPAYYYFFMDAMIEAGKRLGLTPEQARQLTLQTAFGAVQTAMESAETVSELQRQVTSPGGTTAAAIGVFESRHLKKLVGQALDAAVARARQMQDTLQD